MLPSQLVNDVLWHCICPIASLRAATRPTIIAVRPLKGARRARPEQHLIRYYSACKQPAQWPCGSIAPLIKNRYLQNDFFRSRPDVEEQPRAPNIERIYEHLKIWSRKAKYLEVQALVEYIVKTRRERPNNRIYEALILANADALYGSPGEVCKLLQEMEEEGLSPDSGIYHAVLRVRKLQLHSIAITDGHRSSPSIQTIFSVPMSSNACDSVGSPSPRKAIMISLLVSYVNVNMNLPYNTLSRCRKKESESALGYMIC